MKYRIRRFKHWPDFIIDTADQGLLCSLQALYGRSFYPDDSLEEGSHFQTGDGYVIYNGTRTVHTREPLAAIENIIFRETRISPDCIGLHAAAVAYKENAYVFCAGTGTGKTTLTAYLTGKGMEYLTDDHVLVEKASLQLLPYPKPMHIREGGLRVLRGLGAAPEASPFTDAGNIQRYIYQPADPARERYPIDKILFLERTKDKNAASPIPAQEALIKLMSSFVALQQQDAAAIRSLALLTKKCFSLKYCDMEYVRSFIEEKI